MAKYPKLTQLGRPVVPPLSPEEAVLETVPNPQAARLYLVRFACAGIHLALPDDGPARFRPSRDRLRAASEAGREQVAEALPRLASATMAPSTRTARSAIGKRLVEGAGAALAAHRRLLVSARRHADRRVLADRRAARRDCGCPTRACRRIAGGDDPPPPIPGDQGRGDLATPGACGWASMRSALRRAGHRPRRGATGSAAFSRAPACRATWAGSAGARERARRSATLWPEARSVVVLGLNYGPAERSAAPCSARRDRGDDLGLCAGPRLSRRGEDAAQGAGRLICGRPTAASSRSSSTPRR